MFCVSGYLCASTQRKNPVDIGRLLYGKRKNAFHRLSDAKPSVTAMISNVPSEGLVAAVARAIALKELDRDSVLSILKSNRAMRRLDRSELIIQGLRDTNFPLTSHHYSLLMAHANEQRQPQKALEYWETAAQEGKINEKLRGALIATYRNTGNWRKALEQCEKIWEDQYVLDAHALHAAMNACRRHGAWHDGLQVFSQAVRRGTKPNNVVYLELLRLFASAHPMRARSSYALATLNALKDKVDLTAGHYNAVLATLRGPDRWEKGVVLFESMKARNVQPSRETLSALLLLNPTSVSHGIRCVVQAHELGMPVTDLMYRAVFSNLFRLNLDHEASQFAQREYRRDTVDVGNPICSTLALNMAMLDSLLAHPRPYDAFLFYQTFESNLGDAAGSATRQLGTLGDPTRRWIVQGRVAVIDHNVLLCPRMESLIFHYDSIFIPFSSIRVLVRRDRELDGTVQSRYIKRTLYRIGLLLKSPEWSMMRVLPFSHQLLAHHYIVGGPATPDALRALREEAERTQTSELKAFPSFSQSLLDSINGESTDARLGGDRADVDDSSVALTFIRPCDDSAMPSLVMSPDDGLCSVNEKYPKDHQASLIKTHPEDFLVQPNRITSTERVVAVAVMMKTLNPDVDIHVLSSNPIQLRVVERWNGLPQQAKLTPVRYPEELFVKAPPERPNPVGSHASSIFAQQTDENMLLMDKEDDNSPLSGGVEDWFMPS
ncbi:unnamed protein product [Phytomonas sp. Hart1]|nr:unnamed protein product [Phytomonas sp. Hart1]|eukprot:CCW67318.1 unnamed protein product [Phytomonas sp. isolate Hart1]